MSIESVLLPLFVQVVLTFTLLVILAVRRQRMFRNRELHPQDLAVRGAREPMPVAQVSGSFQNQFEIPVLFYVLVILALYTRPTSSSSSRRGFLWLRVSRRRRSTSPRMSCRGADSRLA
jgi:hypothetical protein